MTGTAPIGLQLYSLREALAQDIPGVMRRVADIGYEGVELFGAPDLMTQLAQQAHDLGLTLISAHSPAPRGDDAQVILERAATLGIPHLVLPWLEPAHFTTREGISQVAAWLNESAAHAKSAGLRFSYHNHQFEFVEVDGRPAYEHLLDQISDDVLMEIDTYWVAVGQADPVALTRSLGARAPLLHIKDGPINAEAPMVAVGGGAMDFHAITQAGAGHTEWMIVELDRCATDMLTAVEESYRYLTSEGLAHGKQSA